MKKNNWAKLLGGMSAIVMSIAAISVGTLSTWVIYQPKVPAKLMKK